MGHHKSQIQGKLPSIGPETKRIRETLKANDFNLNWQAPYCLLCAVFLTELSAILYWLMREVTPMDEDYNFVRLTVIIYKDFRLDATMQQLSCRSEFTSWTVQITYDMLWHAYSSFAWQALL